MDPCDKKAISSKISNYSGVICNNFIALPSIWSVTIVVKGISSLVVPTKQCGSIISMGYTSWLLTANGEKSGVYKAKKVGIFKPALLCRDYLTIGLNHHKQQVEQWHG